MTGEQLRAVPVLEPLSDDELTELEAAGSERRLAAGEWLFREGDRAEFFHIVLDGKLETSREVAGEQVLMFGHGPGGYLGAMALLTDHPYRGSTRAVTDTVLFQLDGVELRRLAFAHPALMRGFLPAIESVSGTIKTVESARARLLSVNKLAAGLAHELNNPAAAAARGVATLREYEAVRQTAFAEIAGSEARAEQLAALVGLGAEATDRVGQAPRLDPLALSDREQELAAVLDLRGLEGAGETAAIMTEAGLEPDWVERIAAAVGEPQLTAGLRFVAACAASRVLLAELDEATARIVTLVAAVRSYSYLDQAPRQTVDLHQGLEATVALLAHKLRQKRVEVVRELDPALPAIEASGSELNQVWTNLIDNAIDALEPGGRVTLRSRCEGDRVVVEIADSGPGVPEQLQARIFDAFFTTKPVGQGTGLGLDIAQRIVLRHHGELRLRSQPGDTRFEVVLPLG